jgi:hypothetical protein
MASNNPNFITGQMPPGYGGGASSSTGIAVKDRIEQWYLEPLEKMKGHDAFVCLSVVFLLYEKYLRRTEKIAEDAKFSEGHPVFNQIGKDLGVDRNLASEIWNNWRNGLLHRGMPMANPKRSWALSGTPKQPVTQEGNQVVLNPWAIRNIIVNKVRQKKDIWRDEKAPLMDVFVGEEL